MASEWPTMYLVAACTETSTPCANGLKYSGVPQVLSAMTVIPRRRAASAIAATVSERIVEAWNTGGFTAPWCRSGWSPEWTTVVSSRMEFLPDWTETQSAYSDSNRTESSLHVQLLLKRTRTRRSKSACSSKDRSRHDLGCFPYCRRGAARLAGARRAAGRDRERRARYGDGGPLQRGRPRRGRNRGKGLFQRLHRFDGGGASALTDSGAALRGEATRENRRGDASDRLACVWPRRARRHAARVSRTVPAARWRAAGGRGAHARLPSGHRLGAAGDASVSRFFRSHHRGVPAPRGHGDQPRLFRRQDSAQRPVHLRGARRARTLRSGLRGRHRDRELADLCARLDLLRKAPVLRAVSYLQPVVLAPLAHPLEPPEARRTHRTRVFRRGDIVHFHGAVPRAARGGHIGRP